MKINEDKEYKISCNAATRIATEAAIQDMPVRTWFRTKAYALAYDLNPTFEVSGLELRRTILVGVNEMVMKDLATLAEDLAVPVACIGELIACYNMPETAAATRAALSKEAK